MANLDRPSHDICGGLGGRAGTTVPTSGRARASPACHFFHSQSGLGPVLRQNVTIRSFPIGFFHERVAPASPWVDGQSFPLPRGLVLETWLSVDNCSLCMCNDLAIDWTALHKL